MNNRGRPKKQVTEADEIQMKKSAQRIRNAREQRYPRMSQKDLADLLEITEKSVWRYENGEVPLSPRTAKKVSTIFGSHPDYWMGKTDIVNIEDYARHNRYVAVIVGAMKEATTQATTREAYTALQQSIEGYETMFRLLGYQYSYDFENDLHTLTDHKTGNRVGTFTWDEVGQLITELQHTIGYFVYKDGQMQKEIIQENSGPYDRDAWVKEVIARNKAKTPAERAARLAELKAKLESGTATAQDKDEIVSMPHPCK